VCVNIYTIYIVVFFGRGKSQIIMVSNNEAKCQICMHRMLQCQFVIFKRDQDA